MSNSEILRTLAIAISAFAMGFGANTAIRQLSGQVSISQDKYQLLVAKEGVTADESKGCDLNYSLVYEYGYDLGKSVVFAHRNKVDVAKKIFLERAAKNGRKLELFQGNQDFENIIENVRSKPDRPEIYKDMEGLHNYTIGKLAGC